MNTIVTEMTERGEVAVDIYQKLSDSRVLFISGDIDDNIASDVCATLLLKDAENSDTKIVMFINSRGGDIRNVLAIYDVMATIKSPIETICVGMAMKESVILLTAGTPGMRLATKNSIICAGQLINSITQYSDLTDAQLLLSFLQSDNKKMMDVFAKTTGKKVKQVMDDFERLVFMDSRQALRYGFIDKIITSKMK